MNPTRPPSARVLLSGAALYVLFFVVLGFLLLPTFWILTAAVATLRHGLFPPMVLLAIALTVAVLAALATWLLRDPARAWLAGHSRAPEVCRRRPDARLGWLLIAGLFVGEVLVASLSHAAFSGPGGGHATAEYLAVFGGAAFGQENPVVALLRDPLHVVRETALWFLLVLPFAMVLSTVLQRDLSRTRTFAHLACWLLGVAVAFRVMFFSSMLSVRSGRMADMMLLIPVVLYALKIVALYLLLLRSWRRAAEGPESRSSSLAAPSPSSAT